MISRRHLQPLGVRLGRAERAFYVNRALERGVAISTFIKMALHSFDPYEPKMHSDVHDNVNNAPSAPVIVVPQRKIERRLERARRLDSSTPIGFTD